MSCLDENTAVALVEGSLSDEEVAPIHEHIGNCSDCRRLLSALAEEVPAQVSGFEKTIGEPQLAEADTVVSDDGPRKGSRGRSLSPGERIGRYEIKKRLGEGGMGSVFLASDLDLHRDVAIKLMHSTTPHAAERLLLEARSLAKLRHPNVVTVYDVGRMQEDVYVAMEYIAGSTLRDWLRGEHTVEERLVILSAAASGLAAAHNKGLVHRDFKPDNVMVGEDGRVQVLDFGLAKGSAEENLSGSSEVPEPSGEQSITRSDALSLTRTGTLVGTPAYMAPEQFNLGPTDARTDQFAFCAVLYEAIYGKRPFRGDSVLALADAVNAGKFQKQESREDVPDSLRAAIERGLSTDPKDRFDSMSAVVAAMSVVDAPVVPPSRNGRRYALLGVVAMAGFGAFALTRSEKSDPIEAVLATSDLPETRAEPLPDDSLGVSIHRLSNGLTVFISPNDKLPRVAARMVVRAGYRDDPADRTGVARLAEKTMFLGTDKLGTTSFELESKELAKLRELSLALGNEQAPEKRIAIETQIRDLSIAAAAFAIPDEFREVSKELGVSQLSSSLEARRTEFSAEFPSERLAQWARLEGERWSRPTPRLFARELSNAIAERRKSESSQAAPSNLAGAVAPHLYTGHPYSRSRLGEFSDLTPELLPALEDFIRTRYLPNNAALVLAGDIDPNTAVPILEQAFAAWKPAAFAAHRHVHPQLAESRTVSDKTPSARYVTWAGNGGDDIRELVGATLHQLLNKPALLAKAGPLGQLSEARFAVDRNRGPDSRYIVAVPEPSQPLQHALEAIDLRLAAIESGSFDSQQLEGVIERFRVGLGVSLAINSNRADRIAEAYGDIGQWPAPYHITGADGSPMTSMTSIASIEEELKDLAGRLRAEPRIELQVERGERPVELPPLRAPPTLEYASGERSDFARELVSQSGAERPLRFVWPGRDYEIRDTPTGELITAPNREDETFELAVHWDIGWEQQPALCLAISALDDVGIGSVSADERKRQWAKDRFSAEIECDRYGTSLVMRGLDKYMANADAVFTLLRGDTLTTEVVAETARRRIEGRPHAVSTAPDNATHEFALLGGESDFLNAPSAEFLMKVALAEAKAALAFLLSHKRHTRFFGRDSTTIERFVSTKTELSVPIAPSALPQLSLSRPRIVLHDTGPGGDASLSLFMRKRTVEENEWVAAELLESLARARVGALGNGESSAHFVAWPRPEDGGLLYIGFVAPPADVAKQIEATLAALTETPFSETELTRARALVKTSYQAESIPPRGLTEQLLEWRRRGLEGDPRPARYAKLEQLTLAEVNTLASEIFGSPLIASMVGDVAAVDEAALKQRGDVIVAKATDLYRP